jgi:hypothetical protein
MIPDPPHMLPAQVMEGRGVHLLRGVLFITYLRNCSVVADWKALQEHCVLAGQVCAPQDYRLAYEEHTLHFENAQHQLLRDLLHICHTVDQISFLVCSHSSSPASLPPSRPLSIQYLTLWNVMQVLCAQADRLSQRVSMVKTS